MYPSVFARLKLRSTFGMKGKKVVLVRTNEQLLSGEVIQANRRFYSPSLTVSYYATAFTISILGDIYSYFIFYH